MAPHVAVPFASCYYYYLLLGLQPLNTTTVLGGYQWMMNRRASAGSWFPVSFLQTPVPCS